MKKMPKTNAENVASFYERQRKKGLDQVRVWVPVEKKQELRDYAKKLCEGKHANN